MARRRDFYSPTGKRKEISMRQEMIATMDGTLREIAKHQVGVVRIARRGADGLPTPCSCRDPVSGEPMKSPIVCPLCLGDGFLWDERFVKYYKTEPGHETTLALKESGLGPGVLNVGLRVFYLPFRQDANPPVYPNLPQLTVKDKVVELVLDDDGGPVEPYRREAVYGIATVYDYRLDGGRLEYWKILGYEIKAPKLNLE